MELSESQCANKSLFSHLVHREVGGLVDGDFAGGAGGGPAGEHARRRHPEEEEEEGEEEDEQGGGGGGHFSFHVY